MVYLDLENQENQSGQITTEQDSRKRWSAKKSVALFIAAIIVISAVFFMFQGATTFSTVSTSEKSFWEQILELLSPYKQKDRINILVLGLRGENDPSGGLLTDSIMIISIKKDTKEAALISIPRDLYVEIPQLGKKERINFAYSFGETKKQGGGITVSKAIVSNIAGINIDYAISFDFRAFKEIIDWLGGVDVYLDKPFKEELQWGGEGRDGQDYWVQENDHWTFYVPKGEHHFNGESALYYARSRFTSSDFDRARRQQQIVMSIKNKAISMNIAGNPKKIFDMMDILKRNVKTDMAASDMKHMLDLAKEIKELKDVKNIVISNGDNGLLYSSRSDIGEYILLPKSGNWAGIQALVRNIFDTNQ